MTNKENTKPDATQRGSDREAGSPVTIGGGIALEREAFIKFNPDDWHCDCESGMLTLNHPGVFTDIKVIRNNVPTPINPVDVSDIKIVFD